METCRLPTFRHLMLIALNSQQLTGLLLSGVSRSKDLICSIDTVVSLLSVLAIKCSSQKLQFGMLTMHSDPHIRMNHRANDGRFPVSARIRVP
jgi:hypothetical protein